MGALWSLVSFMWSGIEGCCFVRLRGFVDYVGRFFLLFLLAYVFALKSDGIGINSFVW